MVDVKSYVNRQLPINLVDNFIMLSVWWSEIAHEVKQGEVRQVEHEMNGPDTWLAHLVHYPGAVGLLCGSHILAASRPLRPLVK